jgi:glycosyltransferase involved in cell wall biosynthesis
MIPLTRICITPHARGVGGMVSFEAKLSKALATRGIQVTYDLKDAACRAVLVVGGTRQFGGLQAARRRGTPIVQRLDGINWLHRKTNTGPLHWLRAERNNRILAHIRKRLATKIVYQSHFVEDWWLRQYGAGPASRVIHNGVDLNQFTPNGPETQPTDRVRVLMVEGSLLGGYELGLQSAVGLVSELEKLQPKPVELVVAGKVGEAQKAKWTGKTKTPITWVGVLPNEELPALNRSAHMLYSSDINAACPNSVVEALACGLPVLAFDTGALAELVTPTAGRVVRYGGDPWKLDLPDVAALANGALDILAEPELRAGARSLAEKSFSLDKMVDAYIEALSG